MHADTITWLPHRERNDIACPICARSTGHAEVLEVPSLAPPHQTLRLVRCGGCASVFYERQDIRDFSDLGQNRGDFWRYYVEEGAGVWETIWPVLGVPAAGGARTLLDVGCGFGFTVDFWTKRGKGPACGVELAEYGQVGRRLLGAEIYPELLEECVALAGRTFDVVYASEVIEHVPDPRAFAALLASRVAPQGTLVLTTPNANFIVPQQMSPTQLAALAPGFHAFLLSPAALAQILRDTGFAQVDVQEHGERLVAWASHLAGRHPRDVAGSAARGEYMAYLADRVADLSDDASPVWQGFAFRYVRDLLGRGDFPHATSVARRLCGALIHEYGPAVLEPEGVVARLAVAESLSAAGEIAPYFLPCLYYLLGAIAEHVDRNVTLARRYYAGSAAATVACASRVGTIFHLEAISLLWPARAAQARLSLREGQWSDAAASYVELAAGDGVGASQWPVAPPASVVEHDVPAAADALADAGQRDLAREVARAFRRYVAARYGASTCTIDGLDQAIGDGADVPADPLFLLWFDALDASWAGEHARAGHLLDAVIRIGTAHVVHPKIGASCSDRVARARRQKRALVRATTSSYTFTFTSKPPRS